MTVPASGSSEPRIARRIVVLPAPFGPDEPEEVALGDVEREVGKHRATPVAERRVVERDECGHFTRGGELRRCRTS